MIICALGSRSCPGERTNDVEVLLRSLEVLKALRDFSQ